MTIDLADHQSCTGCGVCAYKCPKDAISLERDRAGFIYPRVDSTKCVQCGICNKYCHVNNLTKNSRLSACFGWHSNPRIREESSSGGLFTALAQTVLSEGGVVYGHVIDYSTLYTHCIRAENEEQLSPMRQSKYVESNITNVFDSINEDLSDRLVLFCGTPCQCAAIKKVYGDNKNLFLISFLCYGVGAPNFFRDHYRFVSKNKKIKEIRMRDKFFGWHDDTVRIKYFKNKDYLAHYSVDAYYYCYISLGLYKRDCCYSCQYTDNHLSDITIGDYWNIVKTSYYDDNKGVSLIIANSEKGKELLSSTEDVKLHSIDISEAEYAFFKCIDPNSETVQWKINGKKQFLDSCKKRGFEFTARKYMKNTSLRNIKVFIKFLLRKTKK